jgi:serine/threonine protein kinase
MYIYIHTGEMLKTTCGTPAYAAPEMTLGQKYDGILVDVWAVGVILFTVCIHLCMYVCMYV